MKLIDISTLKKPNIFTIVDDEDYHYLNQWKWYCQSGYVARKPIREIILMHRELLKPNEKQIIDHINGNPLDNRKENLRICSVSENSRNKKRKFNSASKYKGVCWHKTNKQFLATIFLDKKRLFLGGFKNERIAAMAYNDAAVKYFGVFAKINIIEEST